MVLLVLVWKRTTRERTYSLEELLPDPRQSRWLLIPAGTLYLATGILLRPEAYPPWVGHITIWILYGISFYLLARSKRLPEIEARELGSESWGPARWLALAGVFPLSAVAGEVLTTPVREILAAVAWLLGIAFGISALIKALRLTFPKRQGSPGELAQPSS